MAIQTRQDLDLLWWCTHWLSETCEISSIGFLILCLTIRWLFVMKTEVHLNSHNLHFMLSWKWPNFFWNCNALKRLNDSKSLLFNFRLFDWDDNMIVWFCSKPKHFWLKKLNLILHALYSCLKTWNILNESTDITILLMYDMVISTVFIKLAFFLFHEQVK